MLLSPTGPFRGGCVLAGTARMYGSHVPSGTGTGAAEELRGPGLEAFSLDPPTASWILRLAGGRRCGGSPLSDPGVGGSSLRDHTGPGEGEQELRSLCGTESRPGSLRCDEDLAGSCRWTSAGRAMGVTRVCKFFQLALSPWGAGGAACHVSRGPGF